MKLKSLGKKMLSVFLALIMAVPVIALAPPVIAPVETVYAAEQGSIVPGRNTVTLHGITATIVPGSWNGTAGSFQVNVTGSAPALPRGAQYILYARAGDGEARAVIADGTGNAARFQVRDHGPITNFVNLGSGVAAGIPAAAQTLTFVTAANTITGCGAITARPAATIASQDLSGIRLYMGVITSGGFMPGGGDGAAAGGFVINSATAGASATRTNYVSVNGVNVTTISRRQSPNTATLELVIAGQLSQAGITRVWPASNSSAFGSGRTTPAFNAGTVMQPRGIMSPFVTTESGAVAHPVGTTNSWSIENTAGTDVNRASSGTIVRIEYAPFPTIGSEATVNNVTMTASGAMAAGNPTFTVRIPLVTSSPAPNNTTAAAGTHRVTLGGIPITYPVDGELSHGGTIVDTFRVTAGQAVNRPLVYHISTGGTEAPNAAAMAALTTHHEFFPDVPMEVGENVEILAGVSPALTVSPVANAQFRTSAQDVRVAIPLSGDVPAGTYILSLTSSAQPSLNEERVVMHGGGPITRTINFDLEHETANLINVEALDLNLEIRYVDPSALPSTNIARVTHDTGFWAEGEAVQVGGEDGELVITGRVARPAYAVGGTYRVRVLHTTPATDVVVGSSAFSVPAGQALANRTFSTTMASPAGFADGYPGLAVEIDFFPDITYSLTGVNVIGTVSLIGDEISITTRVTGAATADGVYVVNLMHGATVIPDGSRVFSLHAAPAGNPNVRGGTFVTDIPDTITVNPALLGYSIDFHPSLPVTASPPVSGMVATGMAHLNYESDFITFRGTLAGDTIAGMFTVHAYSGDTRLESSSPLNFSTPVTGASRDFSIILDHTTMTFPANMNFRATFEPHDEVTGGDISSVTTHNAATGVSVSGEWSIPPGQDIGAASITFSGTAGRAGFYRVELLSDDVVLAEPQMQRFAHGANANAIMMFSIDRNDINLAVGVVARLTFVSADNFFYTVNYASDSISFGETFVANILELQPNGRAAVDANGNPILARYPEGHPNEGEVMLIPGNLENISFLFNRRVDRINPNRGNWQRTATGDVYFARQLRNGGYVGVRQRITSGPRIGQHDLIAIIELSPRPLHRSIRAHARDIYRPIFARGVGPTLTIEEGNFIHNPEPGTYTPGEGWSNDRGYDITVRIGMDRVITARNALATERLVPGQRFYMDHDGIPRGSRGTFNIAATETTNFIEYGGEWHGVRDLIRVGGGAGLTVEQLQDLLGEGNFASQQVRFRIPNQPNAPATARMALSPGRNGGQMFIARTTVHMRVKVGYELIDDSGPTPVVTSTRTLAQQAASRQPYYTSVWRPLTANIPVGDFMDLFEDFEFPADNIYEIRIFRNNRVASAPGFLTTLPADMETLTHPSATVANVTVTSPATGNTQGVVRNTNVRLVMSNGRFDSTTLTANANTGTDVRSWFTNLPPGVSARVVGQGGNWSTLTVRLFGMAAAASGENEPFTINIPGTAVANWTEDVAVETNPLARMHINPGPADQIATLVSIAAPAAVTRTHEDATAGDWNLPTTVYVTAIPDTITTASVTWAAVEGFDATDEAAQTATASGTVTWPGLNPDSVSLEVTIDINVEAAPPAGGLPAPVPTESFELPLEDVAPVVEPEDVVADDVEADDADEFSYED